MTVIPVFFQKGRDHFMALEGLRSLMPGGGLMYLRKWVRFADIFRNFAFDADSARAEKAVAIH
jgi:hypothetical protein